MQAGLQQIRAQFEAQLQPGLQLKPLFTWDSSVSSPSHLPRAVTLDRRRRASARCRRPPSAESARPRPPCPPILLLRISIPFPPDASLSFSHLSRSTHQDLNFSLHLSPSPLDSSLLAPCSSSTRCLGEAPEAPWASSGGPWDRPARPRLHGRAEVLSLVRRPAAWRERG